MDKKNEDWIKSKFDVDLDTIIQALKLSPSAQGYIHGALSEILLVDYLKRNNYNVKRIKEKPSGGYDKKKVGYKGDFIINKNNSSKYFVVECKGLKTNSEFRIAKTSDRDHTKCLTPKQAFNTLKSYINIDKNRIYEKGLKTYLKAKARWEEDNKGKKFPKFNWSKENPGPNNADLTRYFSNTRKLKEFIDSANIKLLSEASLRNNIGLYKILQTHEPSKRTDAETNIQQAAPLTSDFSIMAVDLFQRTHEHEFVFMNPKCISHSPTSPNHLYQNYIIDIIIPGIKDELCISHPWYTNIDDCIECTNPKTVEYDETQIDYRDFNEKESEEYKQTS